MKGPAEFCSVVLLRCRRRCWQRRSVSNRARARGVKWIAAADCCFSFLQAADRTGKGNRVLSTMSGSVIRVLAILAVAAAGVSAQCAGNCGGSAGGCFCGKGLADAVF